MTQIIKPVMWGGKGRDRDRWDRDRCRDRKDDRWRSRDWHDGDRCWDWCW